MKAKQSYQVYHNLFSEAIDAAYGYVRKKGFEPVENMFLWESVPYGENRSFHIELTKDGKLQKKHLQMQLYRMDSGRYELNAYIN